MVYSAGKPEESCTRTSQSSEGNKGRECVPGIGIELCGMGME